MPIAIANAKSFSSACLGLVELHDDPAGFDLNAGGKLVHFLAHYLDRRFHQNLRPLQPVFPQSFEQFGNFAAPGVLIRNIVTSRQAAKMGDEHLAVHQTVGADMVGNTGSHDLLGAPSPDPEENFNGGAVHERAGKSLEPRYCEFHQIVQFYSGCCNGLHRIVQLGGRRLLSATARLPKYCQQIIERRFEWLWTGPGQ